MADSKTLSLIRFKPWLSRDSFYYWTGKAKQSFELCWEVKDCQGHCGTWPFNLSKDDVFEPACIWHDWAYRYLLPFGCPLNDIDAEFYFRMMAIAQQDMELQIRAAKFYTIAHNYGIYTCAAMRMKLRYNFWGAVCS